MKTIVYVDGYNLYYSLLRGSAHKWLNLKALFERILKDQSRLNQLTHIKYYTAPVKAKFASHGNESVAAQQSYHKALRAIGCEIILGSHNIEKSNPLRYLDPPNRSDRVEVWSIEEKHTDVNIALDMYRDVTKGLVEQVVLCSNDTDLTTAFRYLREDFPDLPRGLIIPIPKNEKNRRPSKSLIDLSSWVRHHINEDELSGSQFSSRVSTRKKPADKPGHW